ncbi:MAG: ABC transporter permease subunit [Chloroflexi bacterium]|nr:ABC transporter permease subunit [Chloroflexota bacterium]
MLTDQIFLVLLGVVLGPVVAYFTMRFGLPQEDENAKPNLQTRLARLLSLLVCILAALLTLFLLSSLLMTVGDSLAVRLGSFGFLGTFVSDVGDILNMLLVALTALAGAGFLSNLGGSLGKAYVRQLPVPVAKGLTILLAGLAGGVVFALIGSGIDWLYQLENPMDTIWIPGAVGAVIGILLGIRYSPRDTLPIGMVAYYIARTIFNALRSIEALIMVIVFVVWVGIGPFAGVLALSLHTIAALAKLYSEQVESILPGPLEAITATGANRLQTIVYAVIPQIIPPYISFTMYRWDINVRMSTIIGFAGGGGIGFLLIQNINLLNYRAASVQMIAIALVVASMDYLSSKMREYTV